MARKVTSEAVEDAAPVVMHPPFKLVTKRVLLDELHHDAANVRTHDAKNLMAIAGSLKQFGQVEPLVVQKGTGKIVGGNGRLDAMRSLGWTHADVVEIELTETQATALGIALNRTGELAGWDFEALGKMLAGLQSEGFDVGNIGWDEGEVQNLLAAQWDAPELEPLGGEDEGGKEESLDSVKLTPEQWRVFGQAAHRVREINEDTISDGKCLELICQDYLTRHNQ